MCGQREGAKALNIQYPGVRIMRSQKRMCTGGAQKPVRCDGQGLRKGVQGQCEQAKHRICLLPVKSCWTGIHHEFEVTFEADQVLWIHHRGWCESLGSKGGSISFIRVWFGTSACLGPCDYECLRTTTSWFPSVLFNLLSVNKRCASLLKGICDSVGDNHIFES